MPIGNNLLVTLHLSKQWVPLFLLRTWAPTRCGSWVPLMTERRHGLSVRPGQNELAVASVAVVDPARGPLLTEIGLGSDGLKCLLSPPPRPDACLLLPSAHDGTSVMSPVRPVHQKVVSAPHGHAVLGDLAHHFLAVMVLHLLLHLTAGPGIARLPLVVLPGPTWLGGLLGVHPCRHAGVHLLIGGPDDHPGAVSHPLHPGPGLLIVALPYRPLGHLHLKDIGPVVCLRVVTTPGPPARSVSLNNTHQTYISYDSTPTMMTSVPPTPIHVIPLNQNNHHLWMVLSCPLKKCRNFLPISSILQHFRTTRILYQIVLQTIS